MPIRIAHVVEAAAGGVARHLIDLVTGLDPSEYICSLYLSFERPESWRGPLGALRDAGPVLREIPMARVPNPHAVKTLAGWARRDAVDILHLHSAKAGYLGRLAANSAGIPAVYTPHAFPFQRTTDALRPLYRLVERKLARRTAKIICVSEGEREEALLAGLPEEKLIVIPNGIDLARWAPPSPEERAAARRALGVTGEEIVIGALARLVPQKGIDLLVQAAEDLVQDFPNARILIWGDGPQRNSLVALAQRLRLSRMQFVGETDDPARAYAAMDVFCSPSRWEGCPYAVLEAMACGLPVVASDIAGHADLIVDGESGVLCESELPGPLAGALRITLADEDVRASFGAAARKGVEAYTIEVMVESTAAVYREVTRDPARLPN
jgi:glycosyltransferase involved in cell wall biosynthesis